MTKLRAPLTFDNALSRIAGQIGWPAMADAVGQKDRTVRDWGDPDTGRACPITAAVILDLAYRAAGGEGAPMYETYSLLIDQANSERFADQHELARRACTLIREGAEAEEALVLASIPGAPSSARINAARQLEDVIIVATATLPLLTVREAPP